MFSLPTTVALTVLAFTGFVQGQLTGSTGPTTPLSSKTVTCSVLDYGGSVGSSDIGPAILEAFENCVLKNSGAVLYVPAGNYNMKTWVTLTGGTKWAFRLDGLITRASTTSGNMFAIENAEDFEMYSSTSAGGIQGLGYQCRNAGPRLLRIIDSTNFSLHDLIFVDSPEFHITIDGGSSGELYNLAIRGADIGGSDGVDISGDNHWVHDVMVTNRDECVTVKSPASNFLIEQIWCNQSGGCALGSLPVDCDISNIQYVHVYTNGCNQAMMIKSNGGSGSVKNVLFDDFLVTGGSAYALDVNQYWSSMSTLDGDGVSLSNITFKNWDGTVANGVSRPPVQFLCADEVPCTDMTLIDVYLWSDTGSAVYKCESAFGTGACLHSSVAATSYAATSTAYNKPISMTAVPTLAGDLTAGFGSTASIATPTIPSTYYPGLAQITPLMKNL
ncbi:rhamnogalacturonase [Stereum hirsutum FP-91666 SS1]|uniref:rhamnogalacturonase n=1 Tax=Stereum hirsutum (strain FP-91666) TaxID=721885 RepID=UPI00044499A9|nr:rhamnogalacturonase [Stereum hirsutum FP-91666 SS1]EIM85320.1 rhamnogalacturonase [Stereum hirsutum FP-91666 SS1]